MLKWLVCLGVFAALWLPEVAEAGCLSNGGCETPVAAGAFLSPDPGCLEITFEENQCVCAGTMMVRNGCVEPLEALDFTWCRYDHAEDCPVSIEPGATGYLYLPRPGADALGEQTVQLATALGQDEHTLDLTYEMVYVETGCSIGGGRPGGLFWILIPLLLLARRRRRRAAQ